MDTANQLLFYGEKPIPLAPKAYDTLLFLLQNSNRLVTREDLMKAVWPDSFVEDGNVSVNIFQLRKALGETEAGLPYIETVPRKGYRFTADVRTVGVDASSRPRGAHVPLPPEEVRPKPVAPGKGPTSVFLPPERMARGAGAAAHQPVLREVIAFPGSSERPEYADRVELPRQATPSAPASDAMAAAGRLPRAGRRRLLLIAVVGACVLVAIVLVVRYLKPGAPPAARLVERRLTSFAPQMAVTAAAISTGSKFVAYANPGGLLIQVISTGDTHALALPAPHFRVSSISWFPDSAELLIDGSSPEDAGPSMWIVPVIGTNTPVKLGPYPPGELSPDGSKIAWVKNSGGTPVIQLVRSQGGDIRTLVTGNSGETFGGVSWYAGGRRILFVRYRWNAQFRRNSGSLDFYDLNSGKTGIITPADDLGGDAVSLRDGRIIYSKVVGANPSSGGGELIEVRTNPKTGRASGQSRILAKWDVPVTDLTLNSSGTRLALRDLTVQHNVYLADLRGGGTGLAGVRRFSFGVGSADFPRAWSPSSHAIFVDTNRNGNWQIYKHTLDNSSGVPFVGGREDQFSPRVSPDGAWLLYLERPVNWREPEPVNLMRVPISGGLPQPVLSAPDFSEWGLRFECPRRAGFPCLIAQRQDNQIVFRAFDPLKGFELPSRVIARATASGAFDWAVSPDGSSLAWIERDPRHAIIHVFPLARSDGGGLTAGKARDVAVHGWAQLHFINWAPGSKGWFLVSSSEAGWSLLHVEPDGSPHAMLTVPSDWPPDVYPSPDGRHIAFSEQSFGSNVWMLEHF